MQELPYPETVRYRPCRSGILPVDPDAGCFPDITQIEHPLVGGRRVESEDGLVPCRTPVCAGFGDRQRRPWAKRVDYERAVDRRIAFDETERPTFVERQFRSVRFQVGPGRCVRICRTVCFYDYGFAGG